MGAGKIETWDECLLIDVTVKELEYVVQVRSALPSGLVTVHLKDILHGQSLDASWGCIWTVNQNHPSFSPAWLPRGELLRTLNTMHF